MYKTLQGLFLIILLVQVICASNNDDYIENGKRCRYLDTVNITRGERDENGNIMYDGDIYSKLMYDTYDYIIEDFKTNEKIPVASHIRGCFCKVKNCVRICDRNNFTTTINVSTGGDRMEVIDLVKTDLTIVHGQPICTDDTAKTMLEQQDDTDQIYDFLKNGSINIGYAVFDQDTFCFKTTSNLTLQTSVIACVMNIEADIKHQLYPLGMLISLPFLIVTLLVYSYVPELRNLHGKNLMCYVFSLTVLYSSLTFVQINKDSEPPICQTAGYTIYFSGLACFFWLSVLCFEIWSTIEGGMRKSTKRTETQRFMGFFSYAFGIPMFLTIFVILIDKTNFVGSLIPKEYHPQVGIIQENGTIECLINSDRKVRFLYMYSIFSLIMLVNTGLFILTAYTIYKVRKAASSVGRCGDSFCSDTKRFFLYLRLFILMGIIWAMEPISWYFVEVHYIFYISDFLNCLQGLIIFILFVMRARVYKYLRKRCGCTGGLEFSPSVSSSKSPRFSISRTLSSKMSSFF